MILTFSWDRLMIDPLPGPRSADDFTGLIELSPGLFEVLPGSTPKPPAGSSLPRLAGELDSRILLLDPSRGAVGNGGADSGCLNRPDSSTAVCVGVSGAGGNDSAQFGTKWSATARRASQSQRSSRGPQLRPTYIARVPASRCCVPGAFIRSAWV